VVAVEEIDEPFGARLRKICTSGILNDRAEAPHGGIRSRVGGAGAA
jgi:hypothetical protein